MRKPVDYSGFSLKKLNDPRFCHMKLLAGWIVYFSLYFLTENLVPVERCHPVHCFVDDLIPFNEYFLIFYCGWFALVAGSLAYTLFFDVDNFRKIQIFIMITQIVAMAIYVIWPSCQNLRPEVFPRENFFTAVLGFIYRFDTNTGVCPSLHVGYSMGILSVGLKDKKLPVYCKVLLTVFVLCICMSVCFVKQHSFVDVVAALPLALLAEILVFEKKGRLLRLLP